MPDMEGFWDEAQDNTEGVGEYRSHKEAEYFKHFWDPDWPRCKEEVVDKKTKKKRQCQNPVRKNSEFCKDHGYGSLLDLLFEEE